MPGLGSIPSTALSPEHGSEKSVCLGRVTQVILHTSGSPEHCQAPQQNQGKEQKCSLVPGQELGGDTHDSDQSRLVCPGHGTCHISTLLTQFPPLYSEQDILEIIALGSKPVRTTTAGSGFQKLPSFYSWKYWHHAPGSRPGGPSWSVGFGGSRTQPLLGFPSTAPSDLAAQPPPEPDFKGFRPSAPAPASLSPVPRHPPGAQCLGPEHLAQSRGCLQRRLAKNAGIRLAVTRPQPHPGARPAVPGSPR